MPEEILRSDIGTNGVDPFLQEDRIELLTKKYGVSQQAMLIRLTRLDLING
jgi:hypothetical protein